jgi:hypothetical protein
MVPHSIGANMKYTAFLSKLSVEEVSFEASSPEQALTELGKLIKKHDNASNAVVHYALANAEGDHHLGRSVVLKDVARLEASPLPEANSEALQAYFLDQLVKSLSVVEGLAHGLTTEDLAIERESDVDEVLASREYEEEYAAFMAYIVFARRAMNLPDVLAEVGER